MMGIYAQSAVFTAVEHCLAGEKAKSKYPEKPFLLDGDIDDSLTEEQRQERAILIEKQWINAQNLKGLPKTKIA